MILEQTSEENNNVLPMQLESNEQNFLTDLVKETAAFYGVKFCAVTVFGERGVFFLAEYGFGGIEFLDYPLNEPNRCPIRLTCSRPLPVIISDLSKDDRFCDIDCVRLAPKLKFYTAVAINFKGPTQGAMFIADVKSNSNFLLQEADFLKAQANRYQAMRANARTGSPRLA
ncbi:MAG: GAF domain-containing protein [Methylococcales bacterium]